MNQAEMERRLQTLENIEAIKQLKGRYCYYCNAAMIQMESSPASPKMPSGKEAVLAPTAAARRFASFSLRQRPQRYRLQCTW